MHGLPHVLAVAAIVTQLSGCTLLDLLLGMSPDPFDPDGPFPFPTMEASFTSGNATITLEGEAIVLGELAGEAGIDEFIGASVRWTNGDGWYLGVNSFAEMDGFPANAYLTLDWIVDSRHWTILDPSRCVTTIDRVDESGIAGSATCRGLQWADYFTTNSMTGYPEPIAGQAPFDAEIAFAAQ